MLRAVVFCGCGMRCVSWRCSMVVFPVVMCNGGILEVSLGRDPLVLPVLGSGMVLLRW